MTDEEKARVVRRIQLAKEADAAKAESSKPNATGGEDDYFLAVELGERFGATPSELIELGVPEYYVTPRSEA